MPDNCTRLLAALLALHLLPVPSSGQTSDTNPEPSYLLAAGAPSGLPLVEPNDNRTPAGVTRDGVREIALEVVMAEWRLETPDRPGLRLAVVAEAGSAPVIPAPLIRAEAGTLLRVRVHNGLHRGPIRVYGLHTRPADDPPPLVVAAGEERTVEFQAGEPGTYLYWIEEGPEPDPESPRSLGPPEREQVAGAVVVDPVGGSPDDRILVINVFSERVDETVAPNGFIEGLGINGRSWPFTERMKLSVGEPVRWRVVNASFRPHPMHLHGFFYQVLSRGTATGDTVYAPEDRRLVVTETMMGRTTMALEWTPTRPGNWLFHCHLSFHVSPAVRLPGAADHDDGHGVHMAGLVVGIEVAPGPSDLVAIGETKAHRLFANEYGDSAGYQLGFTVDEGVAPDGTNDVPGPMLTFEQYESVDMTVENRMSIPTGIHWHGLEIDAWADGVPGWSRSDGKMSPVIPPGGSFTYRLSFMRPGTFIYHSHLNDVQQLTGGLYGPLIVLPRGETFDPRTDHVKILGWKTPAPQALTDIELNGSQEQPPGRAVVGERHRFRVINIAPAGEISAWIRRGEEVVPITLLARDGADLPANQQVPVDRLPIVGVGGTADFTWKPTEPGTYELRVGYSPRASVSQSWEVVESNEASGSNR